MDGIYQFLVIIIDILLCQQSPIKIIDDPTKYTWALIILQYIVG